MRNQAKWIGGAAALAAGNIALLLALRAHPFEHPLAQLGAGLCAMGLHGWCAWEIGALLRRLSAAAGAEALKARLELAQEARALAQSARAPRRAGQGGSKTRRADRP